MISRLLSRLAVDLGRPPGPGGDSPRLLRTDHRGCARTELIDDSAPRGDARAPRRRADPPPRLPEDPRATRASRPHRARARARPPLLPPVAGRGRPAGRAPLESVAAPSRGMHRRARPARRHARDGAIRRRQRGRRCAIGDEPARPRRRARLDGRARRGCGELPRTGARGAGPARRARFPGLVHPGAGAIPSPRA